MVMEVCSILQAGLSGTLQPSLTTFLPKRSSGCHLPLQDRATANCRALVLLTRAFSLLSGVEGTQPESGWRAESIISEVHF